MTDRTDVLVVVVNEPSSRAVADSLSDDGEAEALATQRWVLASSELSGQVARCSEPSQAHCGEDALDAEIRVELANTPHLIGRADGGAGLLVRLTKSVAGHGVPKSRDAQGDTR